MRYKQLCTPVESHASAMSAREWWVVLCIKAMNNGRPSVSSLQHREPVRLELWVRWQGRGTWWWRGQHFAVLNGAQLACLGPCLLCTEGFELGSEGLASTGSLITRHHGERTASSSEHLRSSNASFLWWLLPAVGDVQAHTAFGEFFSSSLVSLFFSYILTAACMHWLSSYSSSLWCVFGHVILLLLLVKTRAFMEI